MNLGHYQLVQGTERFKVVREEKEVGKGGRRRGDSLQWVIWEKSSGGHQIKKESSGSERSETKDDKGGH